MAVAIGGDADCPDVFAGDGGNTVQVAIAAGTGAAGGGPLTAIPMFDYGYIGATIERSSYGPDVVSRDG